MLEIRTERNKMIAIVEPGNLTRLRKGGIITFKLKRFGKDLPNVELAVVFTPDMAALEEVLKDLTNGNRRNITGQDLITALEAVKGNKEVLR